MLVNSFGNYDEKNELIALVYYAWIDSVNEYEEKISIDNRVEQLFCKLHLEADTYGAIDDIRDVIDCMTEEVENLFDEMDDDLYYSLLDKKVLEDFYRKFSDVDISKKMSIVLNLIDTLLLDDSLNSIHERLLKKICSAWNIKYDFVNNVCNRKIKINLLQKEMKNLIPVVDKNSEENDDIKFEVKG